MYSLDNHVQSVVVQLSRLSLLGTIYALVAVARVSEVSESARPFPVNSVFDTSVMAAGAFAVFRSFGYRCRRDARSFDTAGVRLARGTKLELAFGR